MSLQDLIKRIDGKKWVWFTIKRHTPSLGDLHSHLKSNSVDYLQFAFRWMNNLLMREFPLRCVIRLWDSYLVCHHHTH